jgi:hypothetical protein
MINLDDHQEIISVERVGKFDPFGDYLHQREYPHITDYNLAMFIFESEQSLFNYKGSIYHLQNCDSWGRISFVKVGLVKNE